MTLILLLHLPAAPGPLFFWETGGEGLGGMRRQVQEVHTGSRYQAELWELLRAHTAEEEESCPLLSAPCWGGTAYPAHMSIPTHTGN